MNNFSNKIIVAITAFLMATLPQFSVAEEEAPEEETSAEENENNVNFIYSNKWYDLVI